MAEYIEREALIDALQSYQYDAGKDGFGIMVVIGVQPAADVAPVVHGMWDMNAEGDNIVYCNQCMIPQDMPTPYCPHCGARMDGE